MNNRQVFAIISLAIIAGLVLLCGCTSAPVENTETSQVAETTENANNADNSDKTAINIGYQPSTHQMAFMTAYEKGMYNESLTEYGITEVNSFNFPTGAPEMQAMLAGDLDFAYVGSAPFVTAVATGLDSKLIGAVQVQGSDLVVRTGIEYKSPEDLKGLKIATFQPGTIQDTIIRTWLSEKGINPDTDLEIIGMGPGDAVTAIMAGQVDAVFLPHPSPTTIEEAGAGYIAVHSGEMSPNHACCVLIASGDMIRNHPEIVEAILATHAKATKYNEDNPEEAAKYMEAMTGLNNETIINSLKEWDGKFVSDPSLIAESVAKYAEEQFNLGYTKKSVTVEDLIDSSFYKKLNQ